jgi:hypothetical protein
MARIRWTEDKVVGLLRRVADETDGMMPSASMLRRYKFGDGLCARISRMGGFDLVAGIAGLPLRPSASRKGWRWEKWFADMCRARGLDVSTSRSVKAPHDLTVNGATIDVKASGYHNYANGRVRGWMFNIHNKHRPDIIAVVCLRDGHAERLYFIPGCEPKKTLSITEQRLSKWEKYISDWV